MRRISPFLQIAVLALLVPGAAPRVWAAPDPDPASAAVGGIDEESRQVPVNGVDLLEFPFVPKYKLGSPSLATIEQGSNDHQLRISPQKKGTTTLVIDSPDGKTYRKINYNFVATNLSDKVNVIKRLLGDIEGITIEALDDKIVIDGELVVPRDFDRILQVQDAYKDFVFNLVTLSKISRDALARRMQKEINDDPGGVNVQVSIKNDTFFLTGKVDNNSDREKAETIAQTYMPEFLGSSALQQQVLRDTVKRFAIRNLIVVEEPPAAPPKKMVRITFHFVEIGKDFLKTSFFKWMPFLQEGAGVTIGQSTTGGVASSGNGSFVGTITNLIPRLQSGANGGFARVLFSTVGIGEDGTTIDLLREEQIPYIEAVVNGVPVPGSAAAGVRVKVTPNIVGDRVALDNDVTMSVPVGNAAGGKPRTIKTATTNKLTIRSGESAALGGLIESHTAKDIDRDPEQTQGAAGGAIFTLLRSKAFRNSKTQFVVFVTPKIIEDAAEGTADIKGKILNNSQKKRRRIVH